MANEYYQNPEAGSEYTAPAPEMPVAAPKKSKKGLWIALGAVAVVAIVAVILFLFVFNGGGGSYTTPLDLEMDKLNAKSYKDYKAAGLKMSNGLFDSEAKTLYELSADDDSMEEMFEGQVEEWEDEYGKDYKFYYEVEDKEKIDKDDLKDLQEEIRDSAEATLEEIADTDPEELADYLDLSKSDAKKYISATEGIYKVLKSAKIAEGYELEVTVYVKGKELDEPEEYDTLEMTVVKVNGKWVNLDSLEDF